MGISIATVSPYLYASTAGFVVSSFTSDLLLIRLTLTAAYGFLVLASVSGNSPDGSFDNAPLKDGVIDINMLMQLGLLALHFIVSTRLLLDDHTPKTLPDDNDAEALYNYFRARCGLTQLEFWAIYKQGGWLELERGEEVPHCGHRLYLVVDGMVSCKSCFNGNWTKPFRKRSGEFFDLRLFNLFTLPIGFDNSKFAATSDTRARLFYWEADNLRKMANDASPQLIQFWEFVVVRTLSSEAVKHHLSKSETLYDSLFQPEDPEWLDGGRSHDFSFQAPAERRPRVERVLRWVWGALQVAPPRGVRHQPGLLIENPNSKNVNVSSHGGDEGATRDHGPQHGEGVEYRRGSCRDGADNKRNDENVTASPCTDGMKKTTDGKTSSSCDGVRKDFTSSHVVELIGKGGSASHNESDGSSSAQHGPSDDNV